MRLRTITMFLAAVLATFLVLPLGASDWMQWRGSNHDGVSTETGLLKSWDEGGPKLLWKSEDLGAGYSNLTFANETIFTMGDRDGSCFLIALEMSGKEKWCLKVGAAGGSKGNSFFGPRCTPATDGKLIFAIGQFGDVVCADAQTGKEFWRVNVADTLGGNVAKSDFTRMQWDFSMSPIIDGDSVVLPIGGADGTVIAWEKSVAAPKMLWRSSELTDGAAYTSVVPMTVAGVYQYVVLTTERIAGLDPKNGRLIWQAPFLKRVAVCSDPVVWSDGETSYLMAAAAVGYGTGARGYKVTRQDNTFSVETIWSESRLESHHGGIVQVGGYFYMLTQRELVCVEPQTGKSLWNNRSVGKGSITSADGNLIVRGEGGNGTIALVTASPNGYEEHSRFDQESRTDKNSWTYPIVYDGKLYIRDQHQLFCSDVK